MDSRESTDGMMGNAKDAGGIQAWEPKTPLIRLTTTTASSLHRPLRSQCPDLPGGFPSMSLTPPPITNLHHKSQLFFPPKSLFVRVHPGAPG